MKTPLVAKSVALWALLLTLLAAFVAAPTSAATVTIINNNAPGVGFNDPTPRAPVGGNPGTTLGAQRLFIFQTAASIWGATLPSNVQILVRAQFAAQTCTATSAVLGSAGTISVFGNFPNAPILNTWYGGALANKLSNFDLDPATPDINATFNLNIDAGCFGPGLVWYYGIDGNEGANIELLPVVLHELGHGLGFQTFTSGTSGNYLAGFPSVWDNFILDKISGLHWTQNTPAQRVASAISVDQLVWDGPAAMALAAPFLIGPARVLVNSPGGIAGSSYTAQDATFGAALTTPGFTGNVVQLEDAVAPINDGCEAITNAAALAGNIALIDRGVCTFVAKCAAAQAAGATGVIIVNNVAAGLPGMGGADPTITIPCVGISQADGNTIKANLAAGVNVTIGRDPVLKAGADLQGRVKLYAPNPFLAGSSVSHWDVSLTPNALMEPAINQDLHTNLDLTVGEMRDIGWYPAYIGAQSTTTVICPSNPCVTLPVDIQRFDATPTPALGYSVTFQLSPELTLCAGTSSITEDTYLSSAGPTVFQVVDNGGGSYTVDGAVLGVNCGPTAATGTLFNVAVASAVAGGTGSITVTSVKLRDCDNGALFVIPSVPGTVPIDNQAPVVTVTSPNGGESWARASIHNITWTATDNVGVANVDLAYSTDGGATYPNVIATGVANTGSYAWNLPNILTTTARVQVTAHDTGCLSASDASDADFTIRDPLITASAGAGGTIDPSGAISVPYGTDQAFAISANACYHIADVLVDGASVGAVAAYTFTNVVADHTIDASFAIDTYTIVASAGTGGTITPSGDVIVNCGSDQAFAIAADGCHHILDVLVDGVSVGAVSSYTFTNVLANHTIAASFEFTVSPVDPATGLTAVQVKTGNDASGTTKITITYSAPAAASVEVWRKGYGGYPTYTGSVPPAPASYPPAGWTLTGVAASGQTDQPPTRDYWYYVAYAKDACGNVAPVSNRTGGTLGYHLGDVSDGITPGQGNNSVNTADVSLLGAHYGLSGGALAGFEYLDVGPTTDNTVNGRPTVDSKTNFEDLVMYAINYTPRVSLVTKGQPIRQAAAMNAVTAQVPASVIADQIIEVPVLMSGAGNLQALSVALTWDKTIVEPTGFAAGDFLSAQNGIVLSAAAGSIDAALLGVGGGIAGDGVLATVKFRVLASGDPKIGVAQAIGRSSANAAVNIAITTPEKVSNIVTATDLMPAAPNPMHSSLGVQYSLAKAGPVDLSVYSVDGRRVKQLAHGVQDVGMYRVTWDGTDDRGSVMKAGVYFIRLEAAGVKKNRIVSMVR